MMTKSRILVSYLITRGAGRSSGMRVWSDGAAEIKNGAEAWKQVAHLKPEQVENLALVLSLSGVSQLPARLAAPQGVFDAPHCLWEAFAGGKKINAVVEGWTEQRSNELNLNKLMKQMYLEISAAQMSA